MNDYINITYKNKTYTYERGISLYEISKNFQQYYNYDILCAKINNHIVELGNKIEKDIEIDFLTMEDKFGVRVYERGALFLLTYVINKMFDNINIRVEHSIDKGIHIKVDKEITESILKTIDIEMKKLISMSILFEKVNMNRVEAIKYFRGINRLDRVRVLEYTSNTYVTLYKFNDVYDYFYGEMPYDSSMIKYFKLNLINSNGFVLTLPNIYSKEDIKDYSPKEKILDAYNGYNSYLNNIGIFNAFDLNTEASTGNIGDLIRMDESYQNKKLYDIAIEISKKSDLKIILIAGPSSSGKTTTSKKIALYLRSLGKRPHAISLDDYFLEREETPVDKDGNKDYESINALDLNLFNKHLSMLLNKEEVLLPEYNFITGRKEYKKKRLKLEDSDILIFEGLHALNEQLTSSINKKNKFKLYICPLTEVNIDNYNRIKTTDNRLLRRMIRDNKHRGHDASKALKAFDDVRKGEEKYIFPYQDEADMIFNTALTYEIAVLKTYAEPLLYSVKEDDINYIEAQRLIDLLKLFLPIPSEDVPQDSLLREFIGNGCFHE